MAPLSGRPGGRPDARGQLLLTGAFVLAVLLVVLAVALNAAIVTTNRGTYGSDVVGAHHVHQLKADTAAGAASLVASVNRVDDDGYGTLRRNFSADLARWERTVARHEGLTAADLTLTLAGTTNGTRLRQTDPARPLTNASGVADWTPVAGSDGFGPGTLTVDNASLAAPSDTSSGGALAAGGATRLVATEPDGDRWRVFLYRADNASDDVFVTVERPGGTLGPTCRADPDADPTLAFGAGNVTGERIGATVGGDPCEPLDALATLDPGHDVALRDGANATGTYDVLVEPRVGSVDDGDFGPEGSSTAPYVTEALYRVEVTLGYTTARLAYRTNLTVAPGDRRG